MSYYRELEYEMGPEGPSVEAIWVCPNCDNYAESCDCSSNPSLEDFFDYEVPRFQLDFYRSSGRRLLVEPWVSIHCREGMHGVCLKYYVGKSCECEDCDHPILRSRRP